MRSSCKSGKSVRINTKVGSKECDEKGMIFIPRGKEYFKPTIAIKRKP
jgi:hypothetical protein